MPRTTLDLDASVLRELKRRKRAGGGSIGEIASELLAAALRADGGEPQQRARLSWHAAPMKPRVDVDDKEAVRRALDQP